MWDSNRNSNAFRNQSRIHPICRIKPIYPCLLPPHQSLQPQEKVTLKLRIFDNSASETEKDADTFLQLAHV